MIMLTDDEQCFAKSDQGRSQIAVARHHFERAEAPKGPHARKWNDAIEADTVRKLANCHRWGE